MSDHFHWPTSNYFRALDASFFDRLPRPLCAIFQMFYLRQITPAQRDILETHLLTCPDCLEWLAVQSDSRSGRREAAAAADSLASMPPFWRETGAEAFAADSHAGFHLTC